MKGGVAGYIKINPLWMREGENINRILERRIL
jgi:hypothetical protein